MPELPEVETTLRGIEPHLKGNRIKSISVFEPRMRWPVSAKISQVTNCKVAGLRRRAKYLLIDAVGGKINGRAHSDAHIIIHLGMSGSLRIVEPETPRKKHDHIDFYLSTGKVMRYHDPRRFGAVLWTEQAAELHDLLKNLGPEPLDDAFNGQLLFNVSRKRKATVKSFIMDGHIVVGVGNIYASEALFLAKVRPGVAAGRITAKQYDAIAAAIKSVLGEAIAMGGTTLRDFVNTDGKPGYFQQTLNVYGRNNKSCKICESTIQMKVIGQRSTFYCPLCQR